MTLTEQLGKLENEALSTIHKYGKNADVSCLNLEYQYISGYYDDIKEIIDYQIVVFESGRDLMVKELDVYNLVSIADYLNKINNE